jgi:hypothetical protein
MGKRCVLCNSSALHLFLYLFFLILFICEQSLAQENSDEQRIIFSPPLISEDQFLVAFGRLTSSNDFLNRNLKSPSAVSSSCGVTNMHARRGLSYEIDAESYVCRLRYEMTFRDLFRVSFSGSFIHASGGVFDSAIMNFHDTFSFPNGPRTDANQNRYLASGRLRSGNEFEIKREPFGLQDPVLAVSVPLLSLTGSDSIFLEAAASIPLNGSEFSLNTPDARLALALEGSRTWISYAAGVGTTLHTDRMNHGILYKRFHFGSFFSTTIPIDDTLHVLLGVLARSSITDDIENFPGHAVYLDTGFRIVPFDSHFIDVVLRENPLPVRATADVSLFIRYNYSIPNGIL